jgi:tetratricopeptide (TPR) repeat protein
MWHEKLRNHDLAKTILGEKPEVVDTNQLRATIKNLEANRRENDTDWWNNLAGAHLRLNEPQAAVTLLEPVLEKFPNDYGIHANLGTAYHLIGRYQDAEKEIGRDLEINPDAHFGLEKYHLALLQYLSRDSSYRARHVYVDEYTAEFLLHHTGGHFRLNSAAATRSEAFAEHYSNNLAAAEADYVAVLKTNREDGMVSEMLGILAAIDPKPSYRTKWHLDTDTNFEAGVIYMAQMNPKEPVCFVMLGIAAWKKGGYHLAASSFEKAIALGSPQAGLLRQTVEGLNNLISESTRNDPANYLLLAFGLMVLAILYYIYARIRDRRKAKRVAAV